jgi:hypothetical protein
MDNTSEHNTKALKAIATEKERRMLARTVLHNKTGEQICCYWLSA